MGQRARQAIEPAGPYLEAGAHRRSPARLAPECLAGCSRFSLHYCAVADRERRVDFPFFLRHPLYNTAAITAETAANPWETPRGHTYQCRAVPYLPAG